MRLVLRRLIFLVLCGALMPDVALGEEKKLPPINARVLEFVKSRIDTQVADGDCWKLVGAALATAGARRPGRNGYQVYVFGRLLKPSEAILPGDVVQFSGAKLVSRNGARYDMPRHTAIVASVNGTVIEILHQNWNGVRHVTRLRLDLGDLRAGEVSIFRPQPASR
jgi:hypothetical protein